MQKPFEVSIGLRYLRAQRRNSFISFISLVSILGIALGVAVLIIVLSVMNGFQKEVRGRFLGIVSHIEVSRYDGYLAHWQALDRRVRGDTHVIATAPYINGQALLTAQGNVQGVMVRGIEPMHEAAVTDIGRNMVQGSLLALRPGHYGIVLGARLAQQLGVRVGDKVMLVAPQGNITPAGMIPRMKQFTVEGVFRAPAFNWDASLAMIDLRDAQVLFRFDDTVSGLRLKLDNAMLAPEVKHTLQRILPANLTVADWTDMNYDYFHAVNIEKRMMTVILILIVAVAAFNLVSTLVMVVTDKQADIAILRTLGASPRSIMQIFMIQGCVSGVLGTVCGVLLGLMVCDNMAWIFTMIETISGSKLISSDVYGIDYLPTDVVFSDVALTAGIALFLALIATLYPSWQAARTQPAEALRYE